MTEAEKCSVRIALKEVEAFNRLSLLRRICMLPPAELDRIRDGQEPEDPAYWSLLLGSLPYCLCVSLFPDPPEWSEP